MVAHTGFLVFGRPVTRRPRPGAAEVEPEPEFVPRDDPDALDGDLG
jgi:hypothetical protein